MSPSTPHNGISTLATPPTPNQPYSRKIQPFPLLQEGLGLSALVLVLFALMYRFWFICDDAYISFRYASNLSLGYGLRYNLSENPPVEGYSNFLWVLVGALVELCGAKQTTVLPLLSAMFALLTLIGVYRHLRVFCHYSTTTSLVASGWLASMLPFAVWSSSGLETMAYCAFFYLTWTLLPRQGRWPLIGTCLCALALALARTEGLAWVALMLTVFSLGQISKQDLRLSPVLKILAFIVPTFFLYLAWRYSYFGSLVSNPAKAKVHFGSQSLIQGLKYVLSFSLTFCSYPLALIIGISRLNRSSSTTISGALVLALGIIAFAIVVGGDFMTMGRFLIPSLPLIALGLGNAFANLEERKRHGLYLTFSALLLGLNVSSWFDLSPISSSVRRLVNVRYNQGSSGFRTEIGQWRYMKENATQWALLGKILAEHSTTHESLVAGAIGAVGYYSRLEIFDRFGLVTPEVAIRPASRAKRSPGHEKTVPPEFFLGRKPSYLQASLLDCSKNPQRQLQNVFRWMKSPKTSAYGPALLVGHNRQRLAAVVLRRISPDKNRLQELGAFKQQLKRFCSIRGRKHLS